MSPPGLARLFLRLALLMVNLAAGLAPSSRRRQFCCQWRADIQERRLYLERRGRLGTRASFDIFCRSCGVFRHSLWLRAREWSFEMLLQDVRYGLRLLARRPAFTAVAVLTLGLGIGANATVFSWVEALVLRPLPGVPGSDRLVSLHGTTRTRSDLSFSYPNFADLRDNPPAGITGVLAYRLEPMTLREGGEAERVWGTLVSTNYFEVLDVTMPAGRRFLPEEGAAPNTHPVVVLSHAFWQRRFDADKGVIGRTLLLNERPFTVVGVAPEGFIGTSVAVGVDLWVPLMMQTAIVPGDRLENRGHGWLKVLARIEAGASAERVKAGLDVTAERLEAAHPVNEGRGIIAYPLWRSPSEASGMMAPVLAVVMVVVGVVLLIACANIASLLLARGASRQREVAMRVTLGASRGRLVQQLLTESVLLAALGGAAGIALAHWTADLLLAFLPPTPFPLAIQAGLSPRVFAFGALVTVLTGLIFGLAPALQSSRPDLLPALKEGSISGSRRALLRKGLVAAQVALSVLLLVTAALFLRTLGHARAVDPGFDLREGLLATIDLLPAGYDAERGRNFMKALLERVDAVPGVKSASLGESVPLSLASSDTRAEIEGYTPSRDEEISIFYNRVAPRYFETMGIPLLEGRSFDDRDVGDAPPVVVIDETMARRYWKGGSPVGKRVRIGETWLEVIGVARAGKYVELNEVPKPFMYLPLYQFYRPGVVLHVRADRDPLALVASVRQQVRELDPRIPLFDVMTVREHLELSVFMPRMAALLLGLFGSMALALAAIGLYGVLAHLVSQRTQEIGVRMALGAARGDILRLVISQGLGVTIVGLVVGLGLSAAVTRLVASQLVGVDPLDPVSFGLTAIILIGAALLACYLPARQAAAKDPLLALRYE